MIDGASQNSLISLFQTVLSEESARCCTNTSQDLKTVLARTKREGVSFLTITLPNFGKDFERSLELGRVDRKLFQGFTWKGGLPRFLSGFLGLIFDPLSGDLIMDPSVDAIRAVRQLTLMFGKINLPCTPARENAAIRGYLETEKTVLETNSRLGPDDYLGFDRLSTLLWADRLADVDTAVYHGRLHPSHGPGATADKLKGNQKYQLREWTSRLEDYFPAGEFIFTNPSEFDSNRDQVNYLDPEQERPVKVTLVPKTLKTPRIIAIEPTCMQYAQQALRRILYEALERGDSRTNFVGFKHQEPNQLLALEGSLNRELATLDLSEASDRVSTQHVEHLLRNHPHLKAAVFACRSLKAEVPQHGVIQLEKFASMGSALCFPIEAMVFTTVVFVGIERSLGRQLSPKDIQSFRGKVRVYGDDIIVPVAHVQAVIETLEHFGFKVNSNKSFWRSAFRESCGKEYWAGHDVSIVRVRHLLPASRRNVTELVGAVSLRNQLYKAGLWGSARHLDAILERMISFPVVSDTSPVLGRHSFLGYETQRMHPSLHKPQVKGWTVRPVLPKNGIDGYAALLKYFVNNPMRVVDYVSGEEELNYQKWYDVLISPQTDPEHLERSGRPVRVDIKYGWANSY